MMGNLIPIVGATEPSDRCYTHLGTSRAQQTTQNVGSLVKVLCLENSYSWVLALHDGSNTQRRPSSMDLSLLRWRRPVSGAFHVLFVRRMDQTYR